MADFIKIFLSITALVSAFLFGRSYGEKSYLESEEYKKIAVARDELEYAKGELENTKAKLQNIMDSAETKKTDELLAQILQVFLADLGLTIQNREMILRQAQKNTEIKYLPTVQNKVETVSDPIRPKIEKAIEQQEKINAKLKSYEWILGNSGGGPETLRGLDKVIIKNLKSYLGQATIEKEDCENFVGVYSGKVRDNNNRNFGSIRFDLKSQNLNQTDNSEAGYFGKIAWYNDPNVPLSQNINNTCGRKLKGTVGRLFSLADDRWYK